MKIVYNPNKINLSEKEFEYDREYELISTIKQTLHNVNFEKGVPVKMTGILAELCVQNGKGSIKFYDKEAVSAKDELDAKIEALVESKLKKVVTKPVTKSKPKATNKKED